MRFKRWILVAGGDIDDDGNEQMNDEMAAKVVRAGISTRI